MSILALFTLCHFLLDQRRKVRRQISKLLTKLTRLLQSSRSVLTVVAVLDIMSSVCSEPSFELRTWEIGLVLEGIVSLMSPTTPLLLDDPDSTSSGAPHALTNQDTTRIFTALYHVMINVARFRQEELVALIPLFTTILQGTLHGFKSLHGSIAKRQQGVETLVKSPFMLLSAGAIDPVTPGGTQSAIGDPLPVECAENFARLLTAMGSTFGKHAPYILLEYLTIQCSVAASISQQSLRTALLPGLYALLDLCGDWEREMMMVGLDNTGKTLLKGLYADYLKYFKYTGR